MIICDLHMIVCDGHMIVCDHHIIILDGHMIFCDGQTIGHKSSDYRRISLPIIPHQVPAAIALPAAMMQIP
jgi:hypothetical protein